VPDVDSLRPSPDRVRETLFNWLQGVIDGCVCLDLFAGSGALGFEAASRGAAKVVMIEQNPDLVSSLQKQAQALHADEVEVIQADAVKWLQNTRTRFDLVLLDPPFGKNLVHELCRLLSGNTVLRPGALVYVESEPGLVIDPDTFHIFRQSRAGQVQYMLLEQTKEKNSL
jgi:16S rRNA (guanine966-N2)-methyltransferase